MAKVERIIVNKASDTIILDIGGGIIVPFTYAEWSDDVKRHFSREVNTGEVLGIEVPYIVFEDEIESENATTVYTAEAGWLI